MEHLRTRWAALVVALLLLLSVAGVAGASGLVRIADETTPVVQDQGDDQGQDEDANEDQDEDTIEDEDTTEDQDTEAPDEDAGDAQGEHGAIVSAVAQNKTCVGGPNDNHGWAVSQVARGLLPTDAVTGCPAWVPPVVSETTDTTDAAATHGKSAEHRQNKEKKAKTHGRWASQP